MKTKRLISMLLCIALLGSLLTVGAFAQNVPEWAIDDGTPAKAALQAELPAKYDLRTEGLVTPVKLQNPWGSCWAFAGIAAAETSILSAYGTTYAESGLDLSERHLTYFALQPISEAIEPAQAGEGLCTIKSSPNAAFDAGGRGIYITTLFSQGTGPVPEAWFPFRGANALTNLQYFDEHPDEATVALVTSSANAQGMTYEQLLQQQAEQNGLTTEAMYERFKTLTREFFEQTPCYSANDDWSIPETNEYGQQNRLLTAGVVLKDGNVLPEYWNMEKTVLNMQSVNAIQQELVNGHAVSILYYADQNDVYTMTSDEGGSAYNQYVDQPYGIDHSVCIVGYDDNYPAENFKITPPGNGAWIVKNSWGSTADAAPDDLGNVVSRSEYGVKNDAGEYTGYFYLSYFDRTILQPESMAFTANLTGEESFYVQQYDYMPAMVGFFSLIPTQTPISSANVFTAEETMEILSVSTRTSEENMRVTFAIYALADDAKNPADGVLLYRSSCNFEHAGFHRLDLEQPVYVEKGREFAVISTTSVLNADGTRMYSAAANRGLTQQQAQEVGYNAYGKAVVNAGESYLYENGNWVDWTDLLAKWAEGVPVDNFSIKVYGVAAKPASAYLPGDLNHDGLVNVKDVTFLRRYLAGGYGVTLE